MEPFTSSNEQISKTTLPRLSAHIFRMIAISAVAVVTCKALICAAANGMGTLSFSSGSTYSCLACVNTTPLNGGVMPACGVCVRAGANFTDIFDR